MRGKDKYDCKHNLWNRIPPAYAGKRVFSDAYDNLLKDHPRLCGEKAYYVHHVRTDSGSPPPMRGKAKCGSDNVSVQGITPAYAGKSRSPCYKFSGA